MSEEDLRRLEQLSKDGPFRAALQELFTKSQKREARYTIIAHSLGSIMSLDALFYAHARQDIRVKAPGDGSDLPNLPFPSYLSDEEHAELRNLAPLKSPLKECLEPKWITRVDAFVTLGSPIDKFLVIWWLNYRYLRTKNWMDPALKTLRQQWKIQHFNYCEEQDPVGHNLEVVATAPAYQAVFEMAEDKVYDRHAIPGVAHSSYWKDQDLFGWILARAVDHQGKPHDRPRRPDAALEPRWFDPQVYRQILFYSYQLIPILLAVLNVFAFTLAWYTTSIHLAAVWAVVLLGIWLLGRYVIDLNVWWRLVLRAKHEVARDSSAASQDNRSAQSLDLSSGWDTWKDIQTWLKDLFASHAPGSATNLAPADEARFRAREEARFRGGLAVTFYLALLLWDLSAGAYLCIKSTDLPWGKLLLILAVFGSGLVFWIYFFYSRYAAWQRERTAIKVSQSPSAIRAILQALPASLQDRARFDEARQVLLLDDEMSSGERKACLKMQPIKDHSLGPAVETLYHRSRRPKSDDLIVKTEGYPTKATFWAKAFAFLHFDLKVLVGLVLALGLGYLLFGLLNWRIGWVNQLQDLIHPIIVVAVALVLLFAVLEGLTARNLPFVLVVLIGGAALYLLDRVTGWMDITQDHFQVFLFTIASFFFAVAGIIGYMRCRFYAVFKQLARDRSVTLDFKEYAED
jgi:hypothetical protein